VDINYLCYFNLLLRLGTCFLPSGNKIRPGKREDGNLAYVKGINNMGLPRIYISPKKISALYLRNILLMIWSLLPKIYRQPQKP
jgi:hypothetical protein